MNTSLIGELVWLRYTLLWAKTRSRNGRIALFLAGYLLLVALIALLILPAASAPRSSPYAADAVRKLPRPCSPPSSSRLSWPVTFSASA